MELKSIFGELASSESLQMIVDTRMDSFRKPWYSQYFKEGPERVSLTYETVVGKSRIASAASVTTIDDKAPLRARPGVEKYNGEVLPIQEKFFMDQKTYREYLVLQSMPVSEETKRNQILDLIFDDVKNLGESVDKRLDIMSLEAISTGKITVNSANNPDGVVLEDSLDLLMPSGNKVNADVVWSTSTADPFNDFAKIRNAMLAAGRPMSSGKVLMSMNRWLQMSRLKAVTDALVSFNSLAKGSAVVTLEKVNEYLLANKMSTIEIVDVPIPIEKDGGRTIIYPFEGNNVAFIPDGQLGIIENAIPIEKIKKNKNKDYANFKKALISKWQQSEPWAEWTKIEALEIPAVEAIDDIFLLSTTAAF